MEKKEKMVWWNTGQEEGIDNHCGQEDYLFENLLG